MWFFVKFIDGRVVFLWMLVEREFDEVVRDFDVVVVFVEDYEFFYFFDEWEKRGVEVFYGFILDFMVLSVE